MKNKILKIRVVLTVIAVAFIVTGCLKNEYHDVLMKAVYICLECMGIG